MAQIRNEIYDENGLIEVQFIEVEDEKTQEEILNEKQAQLLAIYNEIEKIKNGN